MYRNTSIAICSLNIRNGSSPTAIGGVCVGPGRGVAIVLEHPNATEVDKN
jgi:hypothetical protein